MERSDLLKIRDAFITCAIWADAPEGTRPRATAQAKQCALAYIVSAFTSDPKLKPLIASILQNQEYGWDNGRRDAPAAFGHDLWLTSQGHGTGFWDREALRGDGTGNAMAQAVRSCGYALDHWFEGGWIRFQMYKKAT